MNTVEFFCSDCPTPTAARRCAASLGRRWRALVLGTIALGCYASAPAARAEPQEASQEEWNYQQGMDLSKAGKYQDAIPFFTKAIEANPGSARAFEWRAYAWSVLGKQDKAAADFDEAIRLEPGSTRPYLTRASAALYRGDYDKAIADYDQVLRLDPKDGSAYTNRAGAWADKGEYDKALADANEALRLDAKNVQALTNRAAAWNGKGEYEKAVADLNEAVRLDPKLAEAYNGLGWLLATCPEKRFRDGDKAFENASRAYQLSQGKVARHIDTVAAAYAEIGDFAHACQWQTKAIEAAATEQEKNEGRSRLELYKQGKPYHEQPAKAH